MQIHVLCNSQIESIPIFYTLTKYDVKLNDSLPRGKKICNTTELGQKTKACNKISTYKIRMYSTLNIAK